MKRAVRTATKNDWKRRWLVLMPTEITYAEAEGKKAKNSLPITGQCRVRACAYHYSNEVELWNPATSVALYFTTESTDQMNEWIVRCSTDAAEWKAGNCRRSHLLRNRPVHIKLTSSILLSHAGLPFADQDPDGHRRPCARQD